MEEKTGLDTVGLDTGFFELPVVSGGRPTTTPPLAPKKGGGVNDDAASPSEKKPVRKVPIRDVLDIFQQLKLSFGKRQR